ncbi:MAG: Mth938-like domain-containing protein [Rhodobacteraceae bacterium]|nr:Mth938-like domain-containing protein [Paracoccaceae bacterium]
MRVSEVNFSDQAPVSGYGPGFFRVGGTVTRGGLALLPSGPAGWAGFSDLSPLNSDLSSSDLLLVGTGTRLVPLSDEFNEAVRQIEIGFEAMSTPAACRVFNILLAEKRRVAALLIPM